jgi:hypothetical protein
MQTPEELLKEYRMPQKPVIMSEREVRMASLQQGRPAAETPEDLLAEYRDSLAQQPGQAQPEGEQPEEPGYMQQVYEGVKEAITGEKRRKAVPGLEEMPEFAFEAGSTGREELDLMTGYGQRTAAADLVNDFKLAAGLMLETSDEGKKKLIKKYMPDVKIEDEGEITYITLPDGTKTVLNKPGFTGEDFKGVLGQLAWFFGPAKIAALSKAGTGAKIGMAAAGEGFAEYARQKTTQALGSEQETDPYDIALATGLGGMTQAAGPIIKGLQKGKAARKLGVKKAETEGLQETIEEGVEAARETGIGLWPGQITESPTALRRQAAMQKLDSSSAKALKAVKQQNKEVGEAVETFLESLAPARTIEEAPAMVIEAAKKTDGKPVRLIKKLDPENQAQADKLVSDIFKPRTTDANVKQIKRVIKKQSPEAWDAITRRRFEDLLAAEGSENPGKVIKALFSNPSSKKQLYAALDTEGAKRLKFLEVAATRAQKGRVTNLEKIGDIERIGDIDRGVWAAVGTLFRPVAVAKTGLSKLKDLGKGARQSVMADAVFNPKWTPDWKALRKLNPQSPAARNKMEQLLNKVAADFAKPTAQALRARGTGE